MAATGRSSAASAWEARRSEAEEAGMSPDDSFVTASLKQQGILHDLGHARPDHDWGAKARTALAKVIEERGSEPLVGGAMRALTSMKPEEVVLLCHAQCTLRQKVSGHLLPATCGRLSALSITEAWKLAGWPGGGCPPRTVMKAVLAELGAAGGPGGGGGGSGGPPPSKPAAASGAGGGGGSSGKPSSLEQWLVVNKAKGHNAEDSAAHPFDLQVVLDELEAKQLPSDVSLLAALAEEVSDLASTGSGLVQARAKIKPSGFLVPTVFLDFVNACIFTLSQAS